MYLKGSHANCFRIDSCSSLEPESFIYKQKGQQKVLKSKVPFKKIANFTGKLQQSYKQL